MHRDASSPTRLRRTLCLVALALVAPSFGMAGAAGPARPFTGAFRGTGRACYGRLDVRTRTLSWTTTFSRCEKVRYRVAERREDGPERAFTLVLERRPKGCRYAVVHLRHRGDDPSIGWEAVGYGTRADERADAASGHAARVPSAMACYLVAE